MGTTSSGLPTIGEVANEPSLESFAGLGNDFDPSTQIPETLVPAAAAPTVQAPPQAAPTAPVAPVAQAPQASPAGQQAPQELPAGNQSTEAQPVTIDSVLQAIQTGGQALADQVIPAFAISPEQMEALNTDVQTEIPKLLASTYLRAVSTSMEYMKILIPTMIQQYNMDTQLHTDAEKEFFGKFKTLERNAHGNDIKSYAAAFAQQNPGINRQQLFDLVGTAVMAKYGLVSQPTAPAPARPQAFSPAVGSAPIVAQSTIEQANPFAGMGMDFEVS